MNMSIDIERLRKDMMDKYGTAAFNGFPIAMSDLIVAERLSGEELVEFAINNGFPIEEYLYYDD